MHLFMIFLQFLQQSIFLYRIYVIFFIYSAFSFDLSVGPCDLLYELIITCHFNISQCLLYLRPKWPSGLKPQLANHITLS